MPWRHSESLTCLLLHLQLLMLHLLMPFQLWIPNRSPTDMVHPLQPMATHMAVIITCNHPTPPMPCHPGLTMTWASATQISMGMHNICQLFPAILPLPCMATHSVWHLRPPACALEDYGNTCGHNVATKAKLEALGFEPGDPLDKIPSLEYKKVGFKYCEGGHVVKADKAHHLLAKAQC